MKKHINKILGLLAFIGVMACSEELLVDNVIDDVTSGGVLRNLGETNSLDIADGSTTYSIQIEAQDASGGNLLQEVIVSVGFNDIDEDENDLDTVAFTAFSTIPASAFTDTSPTTNGLPVATFTATLAELTAHVGGTLTAGEVNSVEVSDAFIIDFQMVLTDGRVFDATNATGDVTRTGTFSFFNGQFRYFPTIGDPQRLVVSEFATTVDAATKLNVVSDGVTDTVFIRFDDDAALTTLPTITARSSEGNPDVVLADLIEAVDGDDDQVYYTLYTGSAVPADTISFIASGGERVAGFTMVNDTLKAGYIVDNVAPVAGLGAQSKIVNGTLIEEIRLEFTFMEALDQDTVLFIFDSNTGQFEQDTVTAVIASGSESVIVEFSPEQGGAAITNAPLDFDVFTDFDPAEPGTPTGGILDLIGNEEPDSVNVQL